MIVLNFAHPLTSAQLEQIAELASQLVDQVIDVPVDLDNQQPFAPQVSQLIDTIDLPTRIWEGGGILINPPGYAPATAVLLAELHGRMGHFPTLIRVRPVAHTTPTRYEVAEIVNLQAVRDNARSRREDAPGRE